jgi:amino acid adenylation domain-containing protein/non-ribosomal peptide synthase protein (TIGR01720 family)
MLRSRAEKPRPWRLSFEQRRLFTLHRLDPRSHAYNLLAAHEIAGALHGVALRRGLAEIVRRHAVLRSVVSLREGEPVQEARPPPGDLALPVIDVRSLPPARRHTAAHEVAIAATCRPYDLLAEPPCRFHLVRLAADRHVLLLLFHHIAADVRSFEIFNDELSALYAAFRRDEPSPLAPLAEQYGDFTRWQQRHFDEPALAGELATWQRALAGLEVTELPGDRRRPPEQTHRGARHRFDIPAGLVAGLADIARERDLSPFMASLAAFLVLLHRYTGATDVNCGIPVSGRTRRETAALIGFFVNMVVVRIDVSGEVTFDAVLDRVKESARAVYACGHLPFDRLVQSLRLRRDGRRNPLYQITFQTGRFPPLALAGLDVRTVFEQDYGIARSDLELYLGDDGGAIFVYNRDVYRAATIAGLARRFRSLCEGLVADPARRIGDVPWLSEAEWHAVVREWNDTAPAAAGPGPGASPGSDPADSIHRLFERQAATTPDAIAVALGDAALTYGELERRANRLAGYLRTRGVGPEVPVGIYGERALAMLVALLGVLKAEGAYVPLSPSLPAERLAAVLADSGAPLALAWGRIPEPDGERRGGSWLDLESLDLAAFPETPPAPARASGSNLAYVIYTSGSTGRPKGVLVEHRSTLALAAAMERLCYRDLAGERLRLSLNAPLEFDASMQQIVMLTRGHCLVIVPEEVRRDGPAFVSYLAAQGVEVLDCTPSHLAVLLDAGLLEVPHGGLRKILAAGGAIDRPLWDRLAACRRIEAYDIYGPTEATVNATGQAIARPGSTPSIGRPLAGYAVYLLDAGWNPVPPGAAGEIFIGGCGVARGYLGRAERTAAAFVPDPFGARGERLYRTGDFARFLPDGALEFLGRRDDQVKVRGMRVELGEVRARIVALEAVRQAAVVVTQGDAPHGQLLAAYVVPRRAEDGPGLPAAVRAELERHLPEHMVPGCIVVLDSLPLTPRGKLDRAALPAPPPDAVAAAPGAALSEYEELLAEAWAAALGVPRQAVGADSSFFELGGHSLLAADVTARLRPLFQVDAPASLVLSHPTLRELARAVAGLRRRGSAPDSATAASAPAAPVRRAHPASPAPLSFAQERIWFLEQLEPGLTAYNIPVLLRLRGPLDAAALAASFRRLVARHEALRTVFGLDGGRPVQRVVAAGTGGAAPALPLVDLAGLSGATLERTALGLAREIAALEIGLGAWPLFRLALVRLGPGEHLLLLCLQHIVADAWSLRILLDELGTLYRSCRTGTPAALPAISLTPADHAVWQRQAMAAEAMEEQLRFWRARLESPPLTLDLPADRPRPAVFRYRGANVLIDVAGDELDRLAQAAARSGITLFMFLTAAVQLLLSRTCGEEDVWIGAPVANRPHPELGGLVGMLINILVLRGRLGRRQTVSELLVATRRAVLDACDHQDVPFEKVVEALNPDRSLSHNPLFQCMLSFISGPETPLDLGDAAATRWWVDNGTAKLDLTFDLAHTGERLTGRLEYNSDLFDRATAIRLAGSFRVLAAQLAGAGQLAGAAPGGGRVLGELPLLAPAERFQIVHEWNDTARERRHDAGIACIHRLFERQAAKAPDRIAVVCGEVRLSYGELERRANRLAWLLLRRCRSPRARVAVYLPRTADVPVALLGVLKAGMCYVPIDPAYPRERAAGIVAASRAELVLTHGALGERLDPAVPQLRLDRMSLAGGPSVPPDAQAAPDDLAYVIFTSGSTGKPKGVVLQHRPVVNLIEWVNEAFAVGPGDTLLFITSLCFDLSVYDVFGTLAAGATVHIAGDDEVKDPEALVELLCTRPITFWDSAPAALAQLQPCFDPKRGRDTWLRLVFLSGDWIPLDLPPAVQAAFPRARVIGLGGATEAAIWSNFFPIGAIDAEWRSIPYGRPIRNARYLVLDAELEPCPINVAGDLYIGGPCLSLGYLDEPLLTARQYLPDPTSPAPGAVLYRTGDRARLRPDGNLEFLGRLDAQVKIRGFRIELGEIEAVLGSHPAVAKAVVLARGDRPAARRLVAYVQAAALAPAAPAPPATPATSAIESELWSWLRSKLPDYMIPAQCVFVTEWPVTANGKLDRRALPAPEAGRARPDAPAAPASADQSALCRIWAEVLGLERVGVDDNFFNLGGDSITAIQIVARANQLGLRLRARDFFQAQTIGAMLPRATRRDAGTEAATEPGAAAIAAAAPREAALTPIQRWFFARQLANPHHFNQAVLLEWQAPLEAPRLRRALHRLCAAHDALRLRFFSAAGGWRQAVRPPDAARLFAFSRADLGRVAGDALPAALAACASQVQATLNVCDGPLVAACLFDGAPQRLLLAVHHLAIDAVSWRFLIEDLAGFYSGTGPPPPAVPEAAGPADRWMRWAHRNSLPEAAAPFRDEEPFWLRQGRAGELPCDLPGGENLAGSAATVAGRLTRRETEVLERRVPEAYRAGMLDVLLTALVLALGGKAAATPSAAGAPGAPAAVGVGGGAVEGLAAPAVLTVDLEGHGRSEELGGGDASRTVGWFTAIHPLTLELDAAAGPGAQLKSIKEQLRAVPREGVGYGVLRYLGGESATGLAAGAPPQVLFNYLGRLDGALAGNPLFRLRTDLTGEDTAAGNSRSHLLEVTCLVTGSAGGVGGAGGGELETRWRFSRDRHRESTVAAWVARFLAALRALAEHCREADAGGRTPSDFPLARIGQAALDALFAAQPGLVDLYPATPMQHGMLFHGELESGAGTYHQQVALDIEGDLDRDAFRAAWAAAIARHACLRTRFVVAEGRYLQAVLAEHGSFWSFADWSGLPEPERLRRRDELGRHDLERPFAAARETPFRVAVARLSPERHHLLVSFHHAILDGWSLAVLCEEVSELYRAARQGRAPVLGAVRPLRDHAAWLGERDKAAANAFWQSYLAGFREPNPLARQGWTSRTDAGVRCHHRALPPDLAGRLDRCARRQGLTRSSIVQAAWALLVGRYSDAADVVVGVTSSGREQGLAGVERMVGLFINTLPLRVAIDEQAAVGAWLGEVQRQLLLVREHDDSALAEVQSASELGAGRPLFESNVVVENYPFSEALAERWLGHRVAALRTWERASFPLTLLVEMRSRLTLAISYEARSFEDPWVLRALGHLENLIAALAVASERPAGTLAEVELLGAAERHQLLREHNDSHSGAVPAGCLHDLVVLQAAATPDRVAVAAGGGCLSYGVLAAGSERLARRLVAEGIAPGDRVALLVERSVEAVAAILAVLRAGAAYVPIDLDLPAGRIELLLDDSGARWALAGAGGRAALLGEEPRPALPASLRVLDLAALAGPEREAASGGAGAALPRVDPGQPAYVIYTSGSTGRPKGVVIEHRSVVNLLQGMHERVYAGAGAPPLRVSVNAPFAFDASVQQLAMLGRGHTLEVIPAAVRTDGAAFVDFLAARQLEGLDITPPHLALLLEAGLAERPDLALRRVVVAGGHIDQAMWDRLAGPARRFFDVYGPTEATVNASGRSIDAAGAVPSIGRPLANYRLLVLDRRLRPLPPGVAGHLFLGGPGLAQGYHGRPALTAERFVPDPFSGESGARLYRTGDLVRRLDDGELEFLGRSDRQLKLRGMRLEPGEIESALRACPHVSASAVLLVEQQLVAFYTTRGSPVPAPGELRALLRLTLPEHMVPADLIHLERLPLLASGKVAHEELARLGARGGRPSTAPRSGTERRLARLWAEALGRGEAEIGVDHDFLSLGGHSLNAVALVARLDGELGVAVSLRELYEGRTIAAIAEEIDRREADVLGSARAAELLAELEALPAEALLALLEQERARG